MACLRVGVVILSLVLLVASCKRAPEPRDLPSNPSTNQQVFTVKGTVKSVNLRQKQAEIQHEAIPGYMPAMTMPFDVKDAKELAGLKAGDTISFRLIVNDTEGWIDQIQVLQQPSTNGPPPGSSIRLARQVEELRVGDRFQEYRLTNQFGRRFSTGQFTNQALAITFLFTRCPYPNYCPRMASNFEETQQKLLAGGGPTNWHLLTISFDPDFDKPEVLRAYAAAYRYEPLYWTFATGALEDITASAEQFGLVFWHDTNGSISHNLRTVVIDAAGHVQRVLEGNNWTSDELAGELRKAAAKR